MSTNLRNIQMVDLKSQYHRIKSEIDEAVLGAIDNTGYINGPEIGRFWLSISPLSKKDFIG